MFFVFHNPSVTLCLPPPSCLQLVPIAATLLHRRGFHYVDCVFCQIDFELKVWRHLTTQGSLPLRWEFSTAKAFWNHRHCRWFSEINHNHRPCRWFAPAPVGHVNRLSLKAHRRVCQPHDFYRHAPKGAFLLAAFYWLTRERVDKLFYTQLIIFIILL